MSRFSRSHGFTATNTSGWSPSVDRAYDDWQWMLPHLWRLATGQDGDLAKRAGATGQQLYRAMVDSGFHSGWNAHPRGANAIAEEAAQVLLDANIVRVAKGAVRGAVGWRWMGRDSATPAEMVAARRCLRGQSPRRPGCATA